MVNVDNIDRNFRNLGLVLLLIAIVILTFWMVYYLTFPNKTNIIWAYAEKHMHDPDCAMKIYEICDMFPNILVAWFAGV